MSGDGNDTTKSAIEISGFVVFLSFVISGIGDCNRRNRTRERTGGYNRAIDEMNETLPWNEQLSKKAYVPPG